MNLKRRLIAGAAALALALSAGYLLSPAPADAAPSAQTTHVFMCAPASASGAQARQITIPNATSTDSYSLNSRGCAVFPGYYVGYLLSQGFANGPNTFTLQQNGMLATTTAATSTLVLPAYAYIQAIILTENDGNAVTGGLNIGDSGSATRFASAVALAGNATVVVADSALTRLYVPTGVAAPDQILIAAGSNWNGANVSITIIYGYW